MIYSTSSTKPSRLRRSRDRRILLGCWGSFNNPESVRLHYKNMTKWGRAMYVTPGVIVDGKLVTTDLVDINLNIRILLGSSYYDGWENAEKFVKTRSTRQSGRSNHPWNQTTIPKPQKRDFNGKYTWVMSPRWSRANEPARKTSSAGYRRRAYRPLLGDGDSWIGGHRICQGHWQQRKNLSAKNRAETRSRI